MGLNVSQVGVKLVDSLEWWSTLELLETWWFHDMTIQHEVTKMTRAQLMLVSSWSLHIKTLCHETTKMSSSASVLDHSRESTNLTPT
jgi:hypothetical protein